MNRYQRRRARALGEPIDGNAPLIRRRELRGFTIRRSLDDTARERYEALLQDPSEKRKPETYFEFLEGMIALGLKTWDRMVEKQKNQGRLVQVVPTMPRELV